MTAELIAEARALVAPLTYGGWRVDPIGDGWMVDCAEGPVAIMGSNPHAEVEARFVARARTLVVELADALEEALAVLGAVISAVDDIDPRLDYVLVQVERLDLSQARALVGATPPVDAAHRAGLVAEDAAACAGWLAAHRTPPEAGAGAAT